MVSDARHQTNIADGSGLPEGRVGSGQDFFINDGSRHVWLSWVFYRSRRVGSGKNGSTRNSASVGKQVDFVNKIKSRKISWNNHKIIITYIG